MGSFNQEQYYLTVFSFINLYEKIFILFANHVALFAGSGGAKSTGRC